MSSTVYDAIVIGSGITGGWAAKELTERGLTVLVIERGRHVTHMQDYSTEHKPIYEFPFRLMGDKRRYATEFPTQQSCVLFSEASEQFFANDADNPYTTAPGKPFTWIRGHQLGGRSLTWGRQSYRMSALNFEENALDGHGVDWPIRYADIAPWYDHVESFIGVAGESIHNPMSPDGVYQPPFPLNDAEREFQKRVARHWPDLTVTIARTAMLTKPIGDQRQPCHYCGTCERGCSAGAYFSSVASTLPAAQATGRLTIVTDSIARKILTDDENGRASGVETINTKTREVQTHRARMIFVCASALESVRLLLLSSSAKFPAGLANSSGLVGKYIMDHFFSDITTGTLPAPAYPNLTGGRPVPLHIPRFRNVSGRKETYLRGYQLNAGATLTDWSRGMRSAGIGRAFKEQLRRTGDWSFLLVAQGECLPRKENQVTLDRGTSDKWGLPVLRMDVDWGENDLAMHKEAGDTCFEMMQACGFENVARVPTNSIPGAAIHEMGGAVMGRDPHKSVLDAHCRAHDVPNLFVTDGAAMSSSSSANPSLTYMALTARAAAFAAAEFKAGRI